MSERASTTVPRAVIVALAAVTVVLAVVTAVLGTARLSHRHAGAAGLSGPEQAALSAARQETINLQTYRLKSFDADFNAAQWQANKATLKTRLTQLKQDAGATVSGAGLVSFDKKSAVVLVASDTVRVDAAGKTTTAAQNRSQVTMMLINGKWLMDDLQSVSVS
jgi:hypothetical protein